MWRVICLAAVSCFTAGAQPETARWTPLFDGKSLQGWKETPFNRRGPVAVRDGHIVLAPGNPMTGITWTGAFPKTNYEIRFEAARLQGGDFFASLTFPAGDSHCTWITGGWGGDIVGLSNIDGWDASENETRTYFNFENGKWYGFRLRVTEERVMAWIDDKPIVNVNIAGRDVSLRWGAIEMSAPLGFAAYETSGGLRGIEYRLLQPR
jgi:hypothetical protein